MARTIIIFTLLLFCVYGYNQEVKPSNTIHYALADSSTFIVPEISTQQLKQIIDAGSALLLDTRPHEEWASGHIAGAINVSPKPGMEMSLYTSDVHEILRLVKGDKNRALVLYCNGPFCDKSRRVSEDLAKEGFTNVMRYQLGTPGWRATGNVLQLENAGLKYFSKDHTAVWVDAREEAAHKKESLKDAVHIPFNRMTGNKNSGVIKEAKDDGRLPMHDHITRIVVFSDNIQEAAAVAAAIAKEAFHNVSYYNGNYRELKENLELLTLPNEEILLRRLKETEDEWKRFSTQRDTAELARLLADEFVHSDLSGSITNKTEQLQRISLRESAPPSSHEDEFTYFIIDRTAVVTYRTLEVSRRLRNTHIFIWRDNRWQAIAHHVSFITK